MRTCSRCKVEKPADRDNFSFIKARDSWHPWCKPCCAEARRIDRAARPDHYAQIDKKGRDKDREKVRARVRAAYWVDVDRHREAIRARQGEHRDRYNANRRARLADPHAALARRRAQRAHRAANPELYRGYAKRAWAVAGTDKRLRNRFTSAIAHSLKGKTKGGRSWVGILGFTVDELRSHLERQFTSGMDWTNYGRWHVDHIVPVKAFSYQTVDDPDFKACWAITNLRPMWARDNIAKRDRRLYLI